MMRRRVAPVRVRPCRGARGQSTVELALVLPFVLAILLAVVQVGVIVHDQVMLTHAAREAVRAAAVSDADQMAPAATAAGRTAAGGLDGDRVAVTVDQGESPSLVHVRLEYTSVTDLPLIGRLLPDVALHAEATMRRER